MQTPVQITFKNLPSSAALEAEIKRRTDQLERFSPQLIGCRVLLEAPNHLTQTRKPFRVHLGVTVPGKEFVVDFSPNIKTKIWDPYITVENAFNVLERQLAGFSHRRDGHEKAKKSKRNKRGI